MKTVSKNQIFVCIYRLFGERGLIALVDGKRRHAYQNWMDYAEGKLNPRYPMPCIWIKGCGCDPKRSLLFRRSK